MTVEIQTLKTLDLFKEMDSNELGEIAPLMKSMRITEGEVLTRRGDTAHTFFIILEGNFMVYFKSGRAYTLHEQGNIIGMSTVLAPFQYRVTTVALTEGKVLSVPGDKFLEMIQGNSALGDKIMRRLHDIVVQRAPFMQNYQPAADL